MRLRLAGLSLLMPVILVACSSAPTADREPLYQISAEEVVEPAAVPVTQRAAGNTSPYTINGKTYYVMASGAGYRETGLASWYGQKFHGRRTANGEVFNAYRVTAAHRSLPLPAYVRVTNLENQRSLLVRVNDRGPFHPNRIIDLSYAAAVKLGFHQKGTAEVFVEVLEVPGSRDLRPGSQIASVSSAEQNAYRYIQIGAFSKRESAQQVAVELQEALGALVSVSEAHLGDRLFYRVRLGPVDEPQQLISLHDQLQSLGYAEARLMPE